MFGLKETKYDVATGVLHLSEDLLNMILTVSASKNWVVIKTYMIQKKHSLIFYSDSTVIVTYPHQTRNTPTFLLISQHFL